MPVVGVWAVLMLGTAADTAHDGDYCALSVDKQASGAAIDDGDVLVGVVPYSLPTLPQVSIIQWSTQYHVCVTLVLYQDAAADGPVKRRTEPQQVLTAVSLFWALCITSIATCSDESLWLLEHTETGD